MFLFFFLRFPEFELKHLEFLVKNHGAFVEFLFQCPPLPFKGQFQEKNFGIFICAKVFAFSTTTFGHPLKIVQQVYQNCNIESRGIVRRKNASSMKPYLSELFELQSTEFMISAKSFDRVVENAIYEFGGKCWGKGLFLRTITIFWIFFWLWAKFFLILVWNSSTGLWKLHFTCSEEVWKSFGKLFDCFVVWGSWTKISNFSEFRKNHFRRVIKRPSQVHSIISRKIYCFWRT